jgi:hypothetical protein
LKLHLDGWFGFGVRGSDVQYWLRDKVKEAVDLDFYDEGSALRFSRWCVFSVCTTMRVIIIIKPVSN